MEKNKTKKGLGLSFGRTGKMGTYTAVMAIVLVAVLVFVNLIVAKIPTKYTKLDTSSNNIYTLSTQTQNYLANLDEDVTLLFICSGGTEDEVLKTFLERFPANSSKVTVKVADPVKDPTLVTTYPDLESAENYSVIAVSEKRSKLVNYSDLYYYYNESVGELSASEYNYYNQMYSGYLESYYGAFELYFSGDSKITGAIEYVTADTVPTIYVLDGHGEAELSSSLVTALFDNQGISHSTLNIALDPEIPEDADAVIINNPSNDLTAAEANALIEYFDKGGCILLFTSDGCDTMTNLMSVTGHTGLSAISGVVSEGDSSAHYPRNAKYIYASFNADHTATASTSSYQGKLIVPSANGILMTAKEGITQTWLIKTTDKATTSQNSVAQSYVLGAAAEKGYGKLVWTASADMIGDTFINATGGYNLAYVDGVLGWMQTSYSSALGNIESISMSASSLTVSEGQANFWGGILIILIPVGCLVAGALIIVVRKRR